jgi:hypothetical protein
MKKTGTISKKEYFRRNNYTLLMWTFLGVAAFLTTGLIADLNVTASGEWYSTHSTAEWITVGCVWLIPIPIWACGNSAYRRYVKTSNKYPNHEW